MPICAGLSWVPCIRQSLAGALLRRRCFRGNVEEESGGRGVVLGGAVPVGDGRELGDGQIMGLVLLLDGGGVAGGGGEDWRDGCAVRAGERDAGVGGALDGVADFVDEAVMEAAQQQQVVQVGGAAVGPGCLRLA